MMAVDDIRLRYWRGRTVIVLVSRLVTKEIEVSLRFTLEFITLLIFNKGQIRRKVENLKNALDLQLIVFIA